MVFAECMKDVVEEMREEVHIPLSPDELMDLVVRDYEIEYEK